MAKRWHFGGKKVAFGKNYWCLWSKNLGWGRMPPLPPRQNGTFWDLPPLKPRLGLDCHLCHLCHHHFCGFKDMPHLPYKNMDLYFYVKKCIYIYILRDFFTYFYIHLKKCKNKGGKCGKGGIFFKTLIWLGF